MRSIALFQAVVFVAGSVVFSGCPGGGFESDWELAVDEIQAFSRSQDFVTEEDFQSAQDLYGGLKDDLLNQTDCQTLVASYGSVSRQTPKTDFGSALGKGLHKVSALGVFSALGAAVDLRDGLEQLEPSQGAELLGLSESNYLELLNDYSARLDDLIFRVGHEGLGEATDWKAEAGEDGKIAQGREQMAHELVHVVQQRAGRRATVSARAMSESIFEAARTIQELEFLDEELLNSKKSAAGAFDAVERDLDVRFDSEVSCKSMQDSSDLLRVSLETFLRDILTVVNAMKTSHDTGKSIIQNIRA